MRVKVYVLVLILITVPLSGCISNGETGTPGMDGPDGLTPLVISSTEGPGSNCAEGGIVLEVGLDLDSDSILESNEIESRTFVCNGESAEESRNGIDGLDGEDGIDGLEGLTPLVISSSEESGSNCAEGGIVLEVGLDLDSDGVLDIDEIHSRTFVCNGSSGEDGSNATSSSNTMLTRVIENLFSPECDPSSRIVEQGLDNGDGNGTAGNGLLEQDEVDYRTKYCSSTELMVQPIFSGQGEMFVLSEFDTDFYFYMSTGIYRHNSTDNSTDQLFTSWSSIERIYSFEEDNNGFYFWVETSSFLPWPGAFWRFEYSNLSAWQIEYFPWAWGDYPIILDEWAGRVLFGIDTRHMFILDTNNHSIENFSGYSDLGYISKWGEHILLRGRDQSYQDIVFRYNVQEKTSNVTVSYDSNAFFWPGSTKTMAQFESKSIIRYSPSQYSAPYPGGTFGYDFTTNLLWKISDNSFDYSEYNQNNPVIYDDRIFGKYWDQGNNSLWVFDNSNETYWPFYDESGSWNDWLAVRADKLVFQSNSYCLMHDSSNDSTWVVDINQDSEEICVYQRTEYHPGFNDDSILIMKRSTNYWGQDLELWVYHTPNNSVWKLIDLTGGGVNVNPRES